MLPWQPFKFSNLDKIHMNRRGLLKNHFCKKNLNICSKTAVNAKFHFFPLKVNVAIATRVLTRLGSKKQYYWFPLPIDAIYEIWRESASWLQRRCCLKMLTTDVCLFYKLTCEPSTQVSQKKGCEFMEFYKGGCES